MRSIFIFCAFLSFFVLGVSAPFLMALGYVWTDMVRPQSLVYMAALKVVPYSFIIAIACMVGYLAIDRRSPPRIGIVAVLTVMFAVWVTLTTTWAVVPDWAWWMWDWAIKSLVFAVFIPFVIRTRNQIEAFLQVYIFSLGTTIIPFGAKVFLSGGGYGRKLGLISANTALGEQIALSSVSLAIIPIIYYLSKNGRIFPNTPLFKFGYLGFGFAALLTALGTYERTALVGLAVLMLGAWLQTRKKMAVGALFFALLAVGAYASADKWAERMSTITDFKNEPSANVRLLVWAWTLDFARTHPFGGGFESYRVNSIVVPLAPETIAKIQQTLSPKAIQELQDNDEDPFIRNEHGRAFHSVYFELLGEHGWPGLFLFCAIMGGTLISLQISKRRARRIPELAWLVDLASALQLGLWILLACGGFVNYAFYPYMYYMAGLGMSVREYVYRVQSRMPGAQAGALPKFQVRPVAAETGI